MRKKNTRKGLRLLAERKISYMNLQAENNMYDQVNQSLKEPMKSVKDQNIHHWEKWNGEILGIMLINEFD